jgi:hypothetical protein
LLVGFNQEVADNTCVYRNEVQHAAAERTQVLQDVTSDPTLPRTKYVHCAACGHGESVFFQVHANNLFYLFVWLEISTMQKIYSSPLFHLNEISDMAVHITCTLLIIVAVTYQDFV